MGKHIEAEGGELLIESSNGYMAIVPKNMADWVREHIKSGNHAVVDNYVKGLKEVKHKGKAQDGAQIPPVRKDLIRPDGTMKDVGFLGPQRSPTGALVTEYSIGVPIMGKEMDIPTIIPGMSKEEIAYVLQRADKNLPIGRDPMGDSIAQRAIQHAEQRAMKGMNPFYSSALESEKLFAVPSATTSVAPVVIPKMLKSK
jgi:hypothetical protein